MDRNPRACVNSQAYIWHKRVTREGQATLGGASPGAPSAAPGLVTATTEGRD